MGFCTTVGATKDELTSVKDALSGSYNVSLPTLAIGSTTTAVSNVEFDYTVLGVRYTKAAVAAGTAPGTDVIPQSTYGAIALDIDAAGTITIASASDNDIGYSTAALAVADIPDVESGKCRMGTVSVTKSDGDFTFGTTALNAANTTVVYTDGTTGGQLLL
jgi:hypothetical protein